MDYKEKITREKNLFEHWKDIRKEKQSLIDLVTQKRELQSLDFAVLYQCVILVLEKFEVYEEEIKNTPEEIIIENKIGLFDKALEEIIKDAGKGLGNSFVNEAICLLVAISDQMPMKERFNAIEQIKMKAWKNMYERREYIKEIAAKYPNFDNAEDVFTVFRCISMVLLELDMQEQEAKILDDSWKMEE